MRYQCKCGRTKTGQPHHSSAVKRWLCPKCARQIQIVQLEIRLLFERHYPNARMVKLVDTRDLKSRGE